MSKFDIWQTKTPIDWSIFDTSCWISDYFIKNHINYSIYKNFQNLILPGKQLCELKYTSFLNSNKKYGLDLYEDLQQILSLYEIENTMPRRSNLN